jgi:hypothetical protein
MKVKAAYFQLFERTLALHLSDDMKLDVQLMIGGLTGEVVIIDAPRKGYDLDGVHVRVNQE